MVILSFAVLWVSFSGGSEKQGETINYVYEGDFSQTRYTHGSRLQPYWTLWPWQDVSGFKIERDEEVAAGQAFFKINYASTPKSPNGWDNLQCHVDFIAIPEQKTTVSFRARGEGGITAVVDEYAVEQGNATRKEFFKGMGGELEKTPLTGNWTTYTFDYQPSGGADIGLVRLILHFHPTASGKVNIMLDDVQAIAKRKPIEEKELVEPPVFTIPKLAKRPLIDGVFSDKEWADAVPLSAFTDCGIFTPPSEGLATAWVGYDADALYIAFRTEDGSPPVASVRDRDQAVYENDSVEIMLASAKAPKERAHFILNAMNSIYDADYKGKSPNVWNPEWQHAVTRDERGWQAEIAIPWNILGWKVEQGLRMNIGHNNAVVSKEKKMQIVSSWAIAKVPGKSASFDLVEAYPIARLSGDGVTAGVTLRYEPSTFTPILNLNLVNPSGRAPDLICSYGTDDGVVGRLVFSPECANTMKIPIPTALSGDTKKGHVVLKVSDRENDETVYLHKEVFQEGFTSAIELKKYFPVNFIEVEINITSLPQFNVMYQVRDTNGNFVDTRSVPCAGGDVRKISIDVSQWSTNLPHTVQVELQNGQGMKLSEKIFTVIRPGKEPWEGTVVGLTDQPLPPYTAIESEGSKIKCLMKEYDYGKNVLPVSIKSEGLELLAGPIEFDIRVAGKKHSLTAVPRAITSRKPNRVEWKATTSCAGLEGVWSCWVEEDGFAWHELTLNAQNPVTVDSLVLTMPVKKDYARLINAMPAALTGDMDGQYLLKPEGWKAIDHKQILSIMNDERGLELTTEDTHFWANKQPERGQSISVQGDCAEVRYAFVDQSTSFKGKRIYAFGIQAFPVKPPVNSISQRNILHAIHYSDAVSAAAANPACAEYPVAGNLDAKQGTLEAWVYTGFDPQYLYPDTQHRWSLAQRFFGLETEECKAELTWDQQVNGWRFISSKDKENLINIHGEKPISWKSPGWHHVSMTWGEAIRIYSDGELMAESKAEGLLGVPLKASARLKDAIFRIGKKHAGYHSDFRVAGLRISSRPLSTSEMALKGNFKKTADTLLLEDFARYKPGGKLATPQCGVEGKLSGDAATAGFEGKTVLSLGPVPSQSRFDWWTSLGFKTFVYHCHQAEVIDLPYFQTKARADSMRVLVDNCHRRGINLLLGFSYGIGFTSREDDLYGDYWYAHPIHEWGRKNDPAGMNLFCVHCSLLTDYLLYYWEKLFDEFHIDGVYTDNVFIAGNKCQNPYHGCGWKDAQGNPHPTGNILAGRRFEKRLYAICKLRERPLRHDMHAGWCNHALFSAWADSYLCGEQYRAHTTEKGWNIDLAQFRVQNYGQRYGMPSHALGECVPFGYEGMWAVALLHDVDVRCVAPWRPAPVAYSAKMWNLMGRFEVDTAEFWPYWKNGEFVTTAQEKRQYASLWLHKGKRALLVVSNLEWKAADVAIKIDLRKLGLKGHIADAFTSEKVALQNNEVKLPLGVYDMKILWVE